MLCRSRSQLSSGPPFRTGPRLDGGKGHLVVLLMVLYGEAVLGFRKTSRLDHRPLARVLSNPMERNREVPRAMRELNGFLACEGLWADQQG